MNVNSEQCEQVYQCRMYNVHQCMHLCGVHQSHRHDYHQKDFHKDHDMKFFKSGNLMHVFVFIKV